MAGKERRASALSLLRDEGDLRQIPINSILKVVDLKLQEPVTAEVEVDAKTLAAIDHGVKAADEGRVLTSEKVRELIPKWISKFSIQNRR